MQAYILSAMAFGKITDTGPGEQAKKEEHDPFFDYEPKQYHLDQHQQFFA